MEVVLSPKSAKYLKRLVEPTKGRIKDALKKLENEPPLGDIKSIIGKDGYRLRIGNYRILFAIENDIIVVTDMGLRGQIYKGRWFYDD